MDDDAELDMRPPDASELSAKQLAEELERRGLKPTGFTEDDIRLLQRAFDVQFERDKEERMRQMAEMRARKRAEEEALKLQRFMERQNREEEEAIAQDPKVAFWIDLLERNITPASMTLRIDPVVVRAFCKRLGANTSLRTLDLCGLHLQDDVGTELGRALKTNHTLIRVDLDNNKLGPKSLQALAEALESNTTLTSLSLERNPITVGTDGRPDYSGLQAFADTLRHNGTIINLNLFQVGLGVEGGRLLADVLKQNRVLVALQLSGTDGMRLDDLGAITDLLRDNMRLADETRRAAKAKRAADRKADLAAKAQAAEFAIKEAEERWVVEQREKRAAERQEQEFAKWKAARKAELDREAEHKERMQLWKAEAEAKDKKKKGKAAKNK